MAIGHHGRRSAATGRHPLPVAAAVRSGELQARQSARPPLGRRAAPTRVIPREPTIQSGVFAGLTRTQATNIAQAAAGGAKPAQVMDQIATERHQNDVIRQGDATQQAIEQQANYERQRRFSRQVPTPKDRERPAAGYSGMLVAAERTRGCGEAERRMPKAAAIARTRKAGSRRNRHSKQRTQAPVAAGQRRRDPELSELWM